MLSLSSLAADVDNGADDADLYRHILLLLLLLLLLRLSRRRQRGRG